MLSLVPIRPCDLNKLRNVASYNARNRLTRSLSMKLADSLIIPSNQEALIEELHEVLTDISWRNPPNMRSVLSNPSETIILEIDFDQITNPGA